MKAKWLSGVLVAGLCLTGVGVLGVESVASADEADNIAKKLVKDARDNKFESFQKRLVGSARRDYGTQETFQTLRERVMNYKKIRTQKSVVDADHGFRVYNVDVFAEKPRNKSLPRSQYVITATAQCVVETNYDSGFCYSWGPGWGPGWWGPNCEPGYAYESEQCSISALRSLYQ